MKQLYALSLLFLPSFFHAQVTINEASNANGTTIIDSDGSTSDWIELYNASASPVNLQGYGLSDKAGEPLKWQFPDYTLAPGGFLVVLASRKGVTELVDHYETAVYPADSWQYLVPSSSPPSNWNALGFNAASWSTGPLGIGYADGDDATTVPAPTTSVFVRREFNIADTSAILKTFLDIDYDDGFVAYLNGTMIAYGNVNPTGIAWDALATDHEAMLYQGGNPTSYQIDPALMALILQNGTNVLAIELHNSNPSSSDLTLIPFLTFGFDSPTTYYGGTIHNWFNPTGSSSYIHTNFSIKTTGETVYLSDPSGTVIDTLVVPDLEPDMSCGKQTDGMPSNYLFDIPTPDATNNMAIPYTGEENAPLIQLTGGFYPGSVSVAVTNQSTTSGVLRYTTTGETPDASSPLYAGPVTIAANTVFKVRCFSPSGTLLPSRTATETYLIMEDFTLPVISISTDNANLYGASGIFDNYTTDWRKPCVIEYFDANGQKQFTSRASIKPDGGAGGSRSNAQHSVTIEPAHGVLGDGEPVHYPLIPEKAFISDYYAFYLRNGSNYWNQYPQKDATFMRIMRESHANSQAYSPVIAYVNGQYFGIYELREKANEGYFETNYGNDRDSLDLLSVSYFYGPSILRTVKGSDTGFYAMHDYVGTYSPAAPDYFAKCHEKIDLYNFTDYLAAENWFANFDWVYNNMKIARTRTAGNKWRFFLQDMELGLGGWGDYNSNMFDYFRYQNQPNAYWDIYNSLSQNTEFRNYFVNRYADLMNTTFQPAYYTPIVNSMYNQLLPELPRHFQQWTGDPVGGLATYAYIRNELLNNQFANRNNVVRNQIVTEYALNGQVDVTLDVSPAGAGYIKISTIVPETLPWTGVYFDGVPVRITAVANPGYTFTGWEANGVIPSGELASAGIELNIPADNTFRALFNGTAEPLALTISEINYHPDPSVNGGNWIELHNYGSTPLSLDAWSLKTKRFWDEYVFPEQTTIPAGGYLVVSEDTALFSLQHPGVTNFTGPTVFDWSNSADSIKIYDPYHNLVLQTVYSDSTPFPICADGWGRTLENQYTASSQLDSSSWFCGCIGGSPGVAYSPCIEPVSFSEINYNNISAVYNAGDWIELKNNTGAPLSLNGYVFRDKKDDHVFVLPDITLPDGGYWVVSADSVLFAHRHPAVENFSGAFDFGLSGNDGLRLYDNQGVLLTSVLYNNTDPWPVLPSTDDYTLEYDGASGYVDPNTASSWFAGCEGGSPGRGFENCPTLPEGGNVGVYPNPATDQLNIVYNNANNSSNATDIELFDLNGNIVHRYHVSAIESIVKFGIDVSAFGNGVYYLRVIQSGRVETVPFVKL